LSVFFWRDGTYVLLVTGFSVDKGRQLDWWVARVECVWRAPGPVLPGKKEFSSKNGLQKLLNYEVEAGSDFWAGFPVNNSAVREAMIKPKKLGELARSCGLGNHPLLAVVVGDLEGGADVGCEGQYRGPSFSSNARSALLAEEQVTDAVASWVKKGFVKGPMERSAVPDDVKINGLMCRPKPDGGVRVIMNMSAPAGVSVNEGIDADKFPAVMSSTSKWLSILNRAGRDCFIMKLDWADAYKHVPVRVEDVKLQHFMWLGKVFAELCLVFGTASSVGIYDRCAKLVLDIVLRISKFPREWVCQHLDDVCAAAPKGVASLEKFHKTHRMVAEQVGVQLAPLTDKEKAFEPCQEGTVLGVKYNTVNWTSTGFRRTSWSGLLCSCVRRWRRTSCRSTRFGAWLGELCTMRL
jgi:hypothetical protein